MKVIDLFAGPGGLGEGFNLAGFDNPLSIECNAQAIQTLRFRKTWRKVKSDPWIANNVKILDDKTVGLITDRFNGVHEQSNQEAWQATLGTTPQREINERIDNCISESEPWALIGGPPCQAYSLVGRARMRTTRTDFDEDHRHFLYREYLKIVANFAPPVFVMENVKGVFSSKINGSSAFERIYGDLREPRKAIRVKPRRYRDEILKYEIFPVCQINSERNDFTRYLVNSEDFGVPQCRHRVILVGIRSDLKKEISGLKKQPRIKLSAAIGDLPTLRSKTTKTTKSWFEVISEITTKPLISEIESISAPVASSIIRRVNELNHCRDDFHFWETSNLDPALAEWYSGNTSFAIANHEARGHMPADLLRYFYASNYADIIGVAPKLRDFPHSLLPNHKNVGKNGESIFNDRFRVQLSGSPSTTITSHISKDGHYYIHPDPLQCRSFTVREAARCQTFPDDYLFLGNRTQQYHQVGNAVPPLLAFKIAQMIKKEIF